MHHNMKTVFILTHSNSDFIEPAAPVIPKLPEDKNSLLRHLEKTNPEALALAGDWDDAARSLIRTQSKLELCVMCFPSLRATHIIRIRLEGDNLLDRISSGMLHLYYRAFLMLCIS